MPIPLEEPRTTGSPVLKQRVIGEAFVGGIIRFDTRDLMKDGEIQLKENGKARQELVVHLLTHTADMAAGIGDDEGTPARGEIVRAILKGGGFSMWIDAKKALGRAVQVGDMFRLTTTHAVRYSTNGYAELGTVDTQADVETWRQSSANLNRKESLGFRGQLQLRAPKDDEAAFVVECEQAYHQLARQGIALEDRGDPFPAPTGNGASAQEENPW
jgi:hypothetical protein